MNISRIVRYSESVTTVSICKTGKKANTQYHTCNKTTNVGKTRLEWYNSSAPQVVPMLGYEIIDGNCLPKCQSDCINGICIAPEQCKCNDGFKMDINDG